MKKKCWLMIILASIMAISLVGCNEPNVESSVKDSSPSSPALPPVRPLEPEEKPNPDYDLGDYDNENDKPWWDESVYPKPPKDEEISGETRPY